MKRRQDARARRKSDGLIFRLRLFFLLFSGIKGTPFFKIAGRAQALIFYVVLHINGHLCAFEHKFTVYLAAVEHGLAPAGANGFHLFDIMRQL